MENKCDFKPDDFPEKRIKLLTVGKINIDKSKCMTEEEFKKANDEFNALYNSSPEMKALIDSWNGMGR